MASAHDSGVLGPIRRAFRRSSLHALSDGQLLEQFLARRDEAAFAVLIGRLGPLVLGVCRRLLTNPEDAEDAFQATFLVMARKARSIRPATVGNWLYGVALRTARQTRRLAIRRRTREVQAAVLPERAAPAERPVEASPALDQELKRLPPKYRLPIILCDLQGKKQKEAARQLGWPQGTLSGRLTRARQLLARRLNRRGLALAGGPAVTAAVSPALQAAALAAANSWRPAAGAGAQVPQVQKIAQGVCQSMLWSKMKVVSAVLLMIALVGGGLGVGVRWRASEPEVRAGARDAKPPEAQAPRTGRAQKEEVKRLDLAEAEKLIRKHIVTVQIPAIQNPPERFPLKELTTDAIWKRLHVQVYQVMDTFLQYETYVIKKGKVHRIGNRTGGFGVTAVGVADLNQSGRPGLVYTFGWGSGVHRAQFGYFDAGSKEPKERIAAQSYFSKTIEDPTLKLVNEQKVEVYLGQQRLGHLALDKGGTNLSLVVDPKLPEEVRQRIRTLAKP